MYLVIFNNCLEENKKMVVNLSGILWVIWNSVHFSQRHCTFMYMSTALNWGIWLISSACCCLKWSEVWSEVFGGVGGTGLPGCCRMLLRVGAKSRGTACFFFFFFLLLASGTQLPHLTFSIWPLPRGEIARVSKRGRHTSWILLSFNLHSPFSPCWCTWIRNGDIAQLRGFLRLLLRYCSYLCAMPRFWCIMDMDIEFITFVWCFDISTAQKGISPATRLSQEIKSVSLPFQGM